MDQNNIIGGDTFLGSKWLNPDFLFSQSSVYFHQFFNYLSLNKATILDVFHTALIFLAIFFVIMICYCAVRLFEIRAKEKKHLQHEIAEYAYHQSEREKKAREQGNESQNPQWTQTLKYLFSEHQSDWKLAVIEADSMLESLLGQLGFKGDTLGDKLKSTDQEKFRSLTSAWEVHNIRNRIAHEGMSFDLSQREAKRVIALYEQIFREYGYI